MNEARTPWATEVLQGRRILVVEDSETERLLLATYLQQEGCRVYLAQDGLDGLKKAALLQLDLILMDVGMPVCDGLAACRRLKTQPRTRGIPVIFLTGAADPKDRVQGLMAGAVDYVTKPFAFDEVRLRLIVHLLARHAPVPLDDPDRSACAASPVSTASLDSTLFHSARQQLIQRLDRTPDLTELARTLGTHNKRLNEVFRKCAGVTVFEYLREERMRQACISLADSVLNVQQIALALGFSSGANFATAFKDRFGLSPSDFRSGRGGSGPAFSLPATGAT